MVCCVTYTIYALPVWKDIISTYDGCIAWNPRYSPSIYSRKIEKLI